MSRLAGRLRRLERIRPPICPRCRIDPTQPPRVPERPATSPTFQPPAVPPPCPVCHIAPVVTMDLPPPAALPDRPEDRHPA